jgi:hypothetical protein
MKIGGKKIRVKRISHKSAHVVRVGAKKASHVGKIAGGGLVMAGKASNNPALTEAGRATIKISNKAGKVGRVAGMVESATA